jgi:hypothetical protein
VWWPYSFVYAAKLWNGLDVGLRNAHTVVALKRVSKCFFFQNMNTVAGDA